jgi:hypothetical protein
MNLAPNRLLTCLGACVVLTEAFLTSWSPAAEWTWDWTTAPGEKSPTAEICSLKYGKRWAYAVEIDDGPKWVASFATKFLAEYHYADAPPGESGGAPKPFVGSAAVIVGATGNNDAVLDWKDLESLLAAGWGVMSA